MAIRARRASRHYARVSPVGIVPSGAFTLRVWLLLGLPYGSSDERNPFVCYGYFDGSEDPAFQVSHEQISGVQRFNVGFTDTGASDHQILANYELKPQTWYCALLMYDDSGGDLTLHVRPAAATSFTLLGTLAAGAGLVPRTPSGDLFIGAGDPTDTSVMDHIANGSISEVNLWNAFKGLSFFTTADKWRERINPANETNHLATWPLDDGIGTTRKKRPQTNIASADTYHADILELASDESDNSGVLVNGAQFATPPVRLRYHSFDLRGSAVSFVDYIEDARTTVTATQETTDYEAKNLRHYLQQTHFRWARTAAGGNMDITFHFFNAFHGWPIRFVGLYDHDILPDEDLRIQMSNDNFATTPVDVKPAIRRDCIRHIFQYTESYEYLRIRLVSAASGPADSYYRIGKIRAGPLFVTATPAVWHRGRGFAIRSKFRTSPSGQRFTTKKQSARRLLFRFPRIRPWEMVAFYQWSQIGQVTRYCDVMLEPNGYLKSQSGYGRVLQPIATHPLNPANSAYATDRIELQTDEPFFFAGFDEDAL